MKQHDGLIRKFTQTGDVLIHPIAVDFRQTECASWANSGLLDAMESGPHIEDALDLNRQILELQAGRDSTNRVVDLVDANPSALRKMSAQSFQVMKHVGDIAVTQGLSPCYYGLADVNSFEHTELGDIAFDDFRRAPMVIRSEADMTARAADIAHTIKTRVESGSIAGAHLVDGQTVTRTVKSGMASFLLYGYTYRPDPSQPEKSVRFPDFPACETFLAATVLEQVALADAVVRIVPRTFKKKEYAARWILNELGASNLPVISVAVGDTGRVNKVMQWSTEPTDSLLALATAIKSDV